MSSTQIWVPSATLNHLCAEAKVRRQRAQCTGENEVGSQGFSHLMRGHSARGERESGISCKHVNRAKPSAVRRAMVSSAMDDPR